MDRTLRSRRKKTSSKRWENFTKKENKKKIFDESSLARGSIRLVCRKTNAAKFRDDEWVKKKKYGRSMKQNSTKIWLHADDANSKWMENDECWKILVAEWEMNKKIMKMNEKWIKTRFTPIQLFWQKIFVFFPPSWKNYFTHLKKFLKIFPGLSLLPPGVVGVAVLGVELFVGDVIAAVTSTGWTLPYWYTKRLHSEHSFIRGLYDFPKLFICCDWIFDSTKVEIF